MSDDETVKYVMIDLNVLCDCNWGCLIRLFEIAVIMMYVQGIDSVFGLLRGSRVVVSGCGCS